MPAGFHQPAAAAQRQREGPGGPLRASAHVPAEEEAARRGIGEEVQGAGDRPESSPGTPDPGHAETGGAEILSGEKDSTHGNREGGEHRTSEGTTAPRDGEEEEAAVW